MPAVYWIATEQGYAQNVFHVIIQRYLGSYIRLFTKENFCTENIYSPVGQHN